MCLSLIFLALQSNHPNPPLCTQCICQDIMVHEIGYTCHTFPLPTIVMPHVYRCAGENLMVRTMLYLLYNLDSATKKQKQKKNLYLFKVI